MQSLSILLPATVAAAFLLSACASVNYQAYEGNGDRPAGQGGTRQLVDGVEFWNNGTPPRSHVIIGVAEARIDSGGGGSDYLRSGVASEVKRRGGEAAIQLETQVQDSGIVTLGNGLYGTTHTTTMRFAVIRYR